MWGRRIGYLVSLLGCLVLYIYYTQWAVWVLLWWLLALPVFSLLLSLPAMLTARFELNCPRHVQQGQTAAVEFAVKSPFPAPPVRYRFVVRHLITGQVYKKIDTTHCGAQELRAEQLRIYDYLGLFCRRVRLVPSGVLIVEPTLVEMDRIAGQQQADRILIPKRSGGFSEEHELREYLPGDDLRQIHWKLSAKTGKTVVRQPMEYQTGAVTVTVLLKGTPAELDVLLGRLKWVSTTLVQHTQEHGVAVLSGRGLEQFRVSNQESLETMMDSVLSAPQAAENAVFPYMEEQTYALEVDHG